MKDEPDILVGFSIYLAEEFLKDGKPNSEEDDKVDDMPSLPNGEV